MHLILGIESSCDETAAAVVGDGHHVLGEVVRSQAADFAAWGGVVPELAARGHIQHLPQVIAEALDQAQCQGHDLSAIAVTSYPGLMGSLLCGVTAAKMCAARWNIPLIAVDHIQAHLCAAHLSQASITYPAIGLVASGGHSHFYHLTGPSQSRLLGGTIDDAAGEAFDKAAAILNLEYPGGPAIDRLAATGDHTALRLPRSLLHSGDLRLSFAGLKTALLYQMRGPQGKDPLTASAAEIAHAAASFQAAVVEVLVRKLLQAAASHTCQQLIIGGGVACNSGLRRALQEACDKHQLALALPEPRHCADNAAMIAALGYHHWQAGHYAEPTLSPLPTTAVGPRRHATPASPGT